MTARYKHIEEIFAHLVAAGYSPRSEKSVLYNCIAFAAGDETRKWAGYREAGYYWPEGAMEGHTLQALMSAFGQLDYTICDKGDLDLEYEKVALYVDEDGLWTHAAKQVEDGQWMSKLGNWEDIVHQTPEALAGPDPAYGKVACFMRRRRVHP